MESVNCYTEPSSSLKSLDKLTGKDGQYLGLVMAKVLNNHEGCWQPSKRGPRQRQTVSTKKVNRRNNETSKIVWSSLSEDFEGTSKLIFSLCLLLVFLAMFCAPSFSVANDFDRPATTGAIGFFASQIHENIGRLSGLFWDKNSTGLLSWYNNNTDLTDLFFVDSRYYHSNCTNPFGNSTLSRAIARGLFRLSGVVVVVTGMGILVIRNFTFGVMDYWTSACQQLSKGVSYVSSPRSPPRRNVSITRFSLTILLLIGQPPVANTNAHNATNDLGFAISTPEDEIKFEQCGINPPPPEPNTCPLKSKEVALYVLPHMNRFLPALMLHSTNANGPIPGICLTKSGQASLNLDGLSIIILSVALAVMGPVSPIVLIFVITIAPAFASPYSFVSRLFLTTAHLIREAAMRGLRLAGVVTHFMLACLVRVKVFWTRLFFVLYLSRWFHLVIPLFSCVGVSWYSVDDPVSSTSLAQVFAALFLVHLGFILFTDTALGNPVPLPHDETVVEEEEDSSRLRYPSSMSSELYRESWTLPEGTAFVTGTQPGNLESDRGIPGVSIQPSISYRDQQSPVLQDNGTYHHVLDNSHNFILQPTFVLVRFGHPPDDLVPPGTKNQPCHVPSTLDPLSLNSRPVPEVRPWHRQSSSMATSPIRLPDTSSDGPHVALPGNNEGGAPGDIRDYLDHHQIETIEIFQRSFVTRTYEQPYSNVAVLVEMGVVSVRTCSGEEECAY